MYYSLIAIVVVLDQVSKALAIGALKGAPPVKIVPGFLQLRYAENTGAAFSILSGQTSLLALFTLVAIVGIGWLAFTTPRELRWLRLGYSLIIGGAIGNLIDRAFRGSGWLSGHVVDFIDAHWMYQAHWPTFNLADSAICVGVAVVGVCLVFAGDAAVGEANADKTTESETAVDDAPSESGESRPLSGS